MQVDAPAPDEAAESSQAAAAKPKKAKAPDTLVREPGKSVLPYTRVQKILKADKELVMVQREAAFLISRATEEFIGRLAEAAQKLAERERRTTVQAKDIVATVRRAEEFAFLEELFPWSELDQAARRKPKALQDKEKEKAAQQGGATMLDHFVSKPGKQDSQDAEDDAGDPGDLNFVMNEDGTMSMVPAEA
ncbi:histone-fold-containing protein [Trametes coccinea BRFM310]|uniref:Histone-fold-containing protein n=1 Tax=Trametes coccinea (strain BRFM310) TaxID=1353009 RepID=A0A1Y2J3V3_TRAC3|nr:histone-fold-containing protein [Trametes coccinea BRFM310]